MRPHLPLLVKFCNLHKHLFPCQGNLLKTWGLGYSDYNSSIFLLKGQYKHTKEHFVFLSKLNPVVLLNDPSLACWEWSNCFLQPGKTFLIWRNLINVERRLGTECMHENYINACNFLGAVSWCCLYLCIMILIILNDNNNNNNNNNNNST